MVMLSVMPFHYFKIMFNILINIHVLISVTLYSFEFAQSYYFRHTEILNLLYPPQQS